ncbi:MAG: prefoldin subunit alpha [Candidatus Odinarchaeota archaeon]
MSNASSPEDEQAALNQKVQVLVYEIQEMEKTVTALQQSSEMLNLQRRDLLNSKETLENMKNREKGERVLVPLGSMLLVPFLLSGEDQTLLRAGSNVLVPTSFAESIAKLDEQAQSLENAFRQTSERAAMIYNQMRQKEAELNALVGREQ